MPVFKAYFKVLRATLPSMLLYLGIYVALAVLFTVVGTGTSAQEFSETKIPLAVINRDQDSALTRGLTEHLAATNQLVDYPDDEEELQDALFFRNVEYIAIIPDGFTEAFLSGEDVQLQKVVVPNSAIGQYVDLRIDKFLNTYRYYRQFGLANHQTEVLSLVQEDLTQEVRINLLGRDNGASNQYLEYYRYLGYILLALIILGVTTVMLAFNRPELQQRINCAPLPRRRRTLQLAAGHSLLALACWSAVTAMGLTFHGKRIISSGLLGLLSLNSLAYTAVCVSIGLLVGSLIKTRDAQPGAVNVITLGMSFLCGVFVPQQVLSPAVLSVAKFLPTYWFVRAIDGISEQTNVYGPMLMQLGFAAAIFSVTLLVNKECHA